MSKRVSLDEKRARMLQIFYEKKEFFTLKELEKIASKEKGIVVQTVKDVLQALVDDGFVHTDKIGSTIYYWTFPGEKIMQLEQRIADSNRSIVEAEFKLQKLDAECKKLQNENENTEEKRIILHELEQLNESEVELKKQISKFSNVDPEMIAKVQQQAEEKKTEVNMWTENIFAIQSWCKNKFNITEETLNKQFHIPEDLDYVE
ncbi:hypothetical protein PV325_001763 [Microctonus aethiopoides]|uniref:Meiotic nuclear division protein 1 homolog n=1 Tax=Microctonus aethiopoides TaxID=144406 RepID=A0AA39FN57_9HYME|nr:hypothetical protein PV325_001763 [Microctonus aethiopoides]KAK0097662.1 hypothetical protein PV326_000344 [Microctonus aethiopoides]KAK0172608.1 hypothetical protein PV328_005906 [Microctonus aethiopoides]